MISFLPPENGPGPILEGELKAVSEQLIRHYSDFIERELTKALLAKFDGKMPTAAQIAKHVICAVDQDHVRHYVWVETKPKVGEQLDMSTVLCSIAPPKIFNPEKP